MRFVLQHLTITFFNDYYINLFWDSSLHFLVKYG